MKKIDVILIVAFLLIGITACGSLEKSEENDMVNVDNTEQLIVEEASGSDSVESTEISEASTESVEEESIDMIMKIGDTLVKVDWEDNESVEALEALASEEPITIQMSMYGGFEQVGSIGQSLPRDDENITTKAGDIVLYSGNQMVVFYGSNSWDYTRLGFISDKSEKELTELLGNGDVTITIENGEN